MNERIRELAEHCDFYVGNEHYNESYEEKQRLWVEKFAELIVRECSNFLKDTLDDHFAAEQLEEHFGIEESKREKIDKAMKKAFEGGVDLSGKETP